METFTEVILPHIEISANDFMESSQVMCICCLKNEGTLINLISCSHSEFLKQFFNKGFPKLYACKYCHFMLMKIEAFRKQVACNFMELKKVQFHNYQDPINIKPKKDKMQINDLIRSKTILLTFDGNNLENGAINTEEVTKELSLDTLFPDFFERNNASNDEDDNVISAPSSICKDEPCSDIEECLTNIKIQASTDKINKDILKTNHEIEEIFKLNKILYKPQLCQKPNPIITNISENQLKTIEILQIPVKLNDSHQKHNEIMPEPSLKFINTLPKQDGKKKVETKFGFPSHWKNQTLYDGKINLIYLTDEELQEEREIELQKESYLNLEYKCSDCIIGFREEEYYKNHIERRHKPKKKSFFCGFCKMYLADYTTLLRHLKRHRQRYKCSVCDKLTSELITIVNHYNQCHSELGGPIDLSFRCKKCNFTTNSHRKYRYHNEKHQGIHSCNLCYNSFVNRNTLDRHIRNVHGPGGSTTKCAHCPKTFKTKSGLRYHMSIKHTKPDEKHYCRPCNKFYVSAENLKTHLKNHKNHLQTETALCYICDYCNKKFMTKGLLAKHIKFEHLKVFAYQCQICSLPVTTKTSLSRHMKHIHEKVKPPKNKICDYCGKGFAATTVLRHHIRTHTGERPLTCTLCGATFVQPAALYTHNRLVHKVTPKKTKRK